MKPYNIAIALFFFRTKKGKTQKQLAEEVGIDQSYVSRIETLNRTSIRAKKPSIETLEKILKNLDVSFSTFFIVAESIANVPVKNRKLIEKMIALMEEEIALYAKMSDLTG